MKDSFDRYIDSLGKLDDNDLYLDIDETMKLRESEKLKVSMTKDYTQRKK